MNRLINHEWFYDGFQSYKPDLEVIEKIKQMKLKLSFEVYLSFHCPDTKLLVPKFFKVLHLLKINLTKKEIIILNKGELPVEINEYLTIKKVPTIIINRNYRPIGRIIEELARSKTIEGEILDIIK